MKWKPYLWWSESHDSTHVCYERNSWVQHGRSVKVFHHCGIVKKWSLVALDRWSLYPVAFDHNLDWENFAVVVMREWLLYQGGH